MYKLPQVAIRQAAIGTLSLSLLASCVSRQQYNESQDWAQVYQEQALEAQKRVVELEAENDSLRSKLRDGEIGTLEAGATVDPDFESKLSDLKSQLSQLNRPPGPIERFEVAGGYVLMIQDKVLFSSGSYDLGEEGRRELIKLAKEIQSTPHGRIMVRGHTDNVPVVKPKTLERLPYGNLQLSAMRAVSVASLLIKEGGLPGADVVVEGFGPWEPIASNDSAENRRLNRRVEIFVEESR